MTHTPFKCWLDRIQWPSPRWALCAGAAAALVFAFSGCANDAGNASPSDHNRSSGMRDAPAPDRGALPDKASPIGQVAQPGLELEAARNLETRPEGGSPEDEEGPSGVSGEVIERGRASWYGRRFQGRSTASGEPFDMHELTAAHRTLPFGSRVRVRSLRNGREVVVRINDRGPFTKDRVIDLSQAAMKALGLRARGVVRVELLRE